MKTTKNIARLAVTAGLTAALSFGGVMAPVTMAFADDATGSITIKQVAKDNEDNTFKAYQIFKAKVDDVEGEGKVASDIEWANDAIGPKVIAAIQGSEEYKKIVASNSAKGLDKNANAQVVAEWLSENVNGNSSTATSSDGTRVAPGDVLYEIAAAVSGKTDGVTAESPAGTLTADTSWTRPGEKGDGYYLFVPDGLTEQTKPNTGTSPIFAIVGGNHVTVTEKTSIPTVMKKVKNDDGSGWADKADSQMGQDVQYQLTGTVADNIATFNTYYYEFSDNLSDGLTADGNSVVVKIGNMTLSPNTTPGATTGYDVSIDDVSNTLTVKFADLKAAANQAGATLDGSSDVVVTYTAQLDFTKAEKVVVGGAGNENTVKLIYSNNPMGDGKGESVPDTVRDYTYALKIIKQDAASEATKLDGVRFTIQATDPDDAGSKNKYVNSDGVLVGNSYEFTTANGGEIYVKGLDAGTYTVHEVEGSNPGYNTLPDFTFKISTVKEDGTDSLKRPEGENTLYVTASKSNADLVEEPRVDDGTVILTVKNKKGSNLPLTGLNGVTFTWIAGGAVLCIGVAHLIRSRKRDDGSEE